MKLTELEFSLSDSPCFGIADEIVLNNSQIFAFLIVSFVTDTDKHETVFSSFPHRIKGNLNWIHSVWNADLLFKFVDV